MVVKGKGLSCANRITIERKTRLRFIRNGNYLARCIYASDVVFYSQTDFVVANTGEVDWLKGVSSGKQLVVHNPIVAYNVGLRTRCKLY